MNAVVDEQLPEASAGSAERAALASALSERLSGAVSGSLPVQPGGRLSRIAEMFGLTPFETDVLATLWIVAFEPSLRRSLLSADRASAQVTPGGIARIFGSASCVRLSSGSSLLRWRLVDEHPLLDGGAALVIDAQVLAWLEGEHELDRHLVSVARLVAPTFELPSWALESWVKKIRDGSRRGWHYRVCLDTPDASLSLACAGAIARRLDLPLLVVTAPLGGTEEGMDRVMRVHRQAYLDGCAPFFACGAPAQSPPVSFPLQFVPGTSVNASADGVRDLRLRLPPPDASERALLWQWALPSVSGWPASDRRDLEVRGIACAGEILRAAATEPADPAGAFRALRETEEDDLGGLAQRIDASFGWDDLVVPASVRERLTEIAFEARERDRLWAEPGAARLYPQGRGLVALFAGPPGTGKTMAAQVIAAELGLDLLRVDVSAVLSKWVGETAQHLQKILSARSARRAVLFFDEADALYGKRVDEVRDAQDRFANMDISHLMVALEAYDGIILMATNLRANIDAAFLRRIRHCVEFTRPDESARQAIWQRVVAGLFGADFASSVGVGALAKLDATGAQIKNAALSALFAARRAGQAPDKLLFGRMLARELAKDGTGLATRELDAALGVEQ